MFKKVMQTNFKKLYYYKLLYIFINIICKNCKEIYNKTVSKQKAVNSKNRSVLKCLSVVIKEAKTIYV